MKHMKKLLSFVLVLTLCLGLAVPASAAAVQPTPSSNVNQQNYYNDWPTGTQSYLFENPAGGLTRVEYIGTYDGKKVIVEDYDSQFRCQASRTIPMELPNWNGFYAGEDYNFFVFEQTTSEESQDKEVVRVVKYSKDWQRLDAASLCGINSTSVGGNALRCAEYGGYLYVHTDHGMFRSSDGKRHQSNMSFSVRESDMAVTSGFYRPVSNSGYVSHSFNQFILVDQDRNVVTLDHGDGYPRALTLFRYNAKAGQDNLFGGAGTRKNLLTFPGDIGQNYTGAEVGGFAETASGYVAAYNYDGHDAWADNDMYLAFVDKNLSDVKTAKLSSGYNTSTPQLAPTGLDGGYIMWNGKLKGYYEFDNNLYYARYDANGNVGQVQRATAPLSDCAPIYWNGKVVWYVTNGRYVPNTGTAAPVFYTLDSNGVTSHKTVEADDTPAGTAYANTQTVLLNGRRVTFQTYALKESGGLTNYIKLRDMAYYLNGTKAQFSVGWSAEQGITLAAGRPYTPNGSELSTPFSGDRAYTGGSQLIHIDDFPVMMSAITLTDDAGGGYTYFKLRELGLILGFNVSYINGQVVINTNQPYSDAQ